MIVERKNNFISVIKNDSEKEKGLNFIQIHLLHMIMIHIPGAIRKFAHYCHNFKITRNIRVAKTKVLISFVVTAKLVCAFIFAYANC